MSTTVRESLQRWKTDREFRRRVGVVLVMLSLLVAVFVAWKLRLTGIALAGEAYCGQKEHTHTEDCMAKVLVCELGDEYSDDSTEMYFDGLALSAEDNDGVLICGMEEHEHSVNDGCYEKRLVLTCTEDHEHTEDCYEKRYVLICGLTQHIHDEMCYTSESLSLDDFDEPVPVGDEEEHVHTDDCYQLMPACGKVEHVHTLACYSNSSADVEESSDWEATLPALSGNWAEDVAAVAQGQLGYSESTLNYTLDDDGNKKGYTRFGEWYGNPYGNWDAMFASFCVHYAGMTEDVVPYGSGSAAWVVQLKEAGLYQDAAAYEPKTGDLVFFDADGDTKADGVAVIESVDDGTLTVLVGDSNTEDEDVHAVERLDYSVADASILGYCEIPENPDAAASGTSGTTAATGTKTSTTTSDSLTELEAEMELEAEAEEAFAEGATSFAGVYRVDSAYAESYSLYGLSSGAGEDEFSQYGLSLTSELSEVSAETEGDDLSKYVTSIEIMKLEGNVWKDVTDDTVFTEGDGIRVGLNFTFPLSTATSDNRTFVYSLPDGVRPNEDLSGTVYDETGNNVGTYTISKETGKIVITLKESYADGSVISGTLQFSGSVSMTEDEEEQEYTFPGSGTSTTIKVEKEKSTDDEHDLKIEKSSGTVSDDKKTVTYTVKISSTKGSNGGITFTDVLTGSAKTNASTVTIVKKSTTDASVEEPVSGITASVSDDGKLSLSKALPALSAGEYYEITYKVDVDTNAGQSSNGEVVLKNTANAKDDTHDKSVWEVTTTVTTPKIEKNGNWDVDSSTIYWSITLTPQGTDFKDKKLQDFMTGGTDSDKEKTITSITVTYKEALGNNAVKRVYTSNGTGGTWTYYDADGTIVDTKSVTEKIDLNNDSSWTIDESTTNWETCVIEYTTTVSHDSAIANTSFTNTGTIDGYTDGHTVGTDARDWDVGKKVEGGQTTNADFSQNITWKSTISLPSTAVLNKLGDDAEGVFTYTDYILDVDGNQNAEKHYGTRSAIEAKLAETMTLTVVKDGTTVSGIKGDNLDSYLTYNVKYFDEDGNEVTDDIGKVTRFVITFTGVSSEYTGKKIEFEYPTVGVVDRSLVGETQYWKNEGALPGGKTTGEISASYEKKADLKKTASSTAWSSSEIGSYKEYDAFDPETEIAVDADSNEIVLWYRIIWKPTSNETQVLTDTLPEGVTYVEGSGYARYVSFTSGDDNNVDKITGIWSNSEAKTEHYSDWGGYNGHNWTNANSTPIFKQNGTELTITIPGGFMYFLPEDADRDTIGIGIWYAVKVDKNSDLWKQIVSNGADLKNSVEWEGETSDTTTHVEMENIVIEKTSEVLEPTEAGNIIPVRYGIIINSQGKDLVENSDEVTLVDTMNYGKAVDASLDVARDLTLYYYDSTLTNPDDYEKSGIKVSTSLYRVTYTDTEDGERTFNITVPDSMALYLVYTYDVDLDANTQNATATVSNEAKLAGKTSKQDDTEIKVNEHWAGVAKKTLQFVKVDKDDYSKLLGNAEFDLYTPNASRTDWEKVNDSTLRTEENDGTITFATNETNGTVIAQDTLYKLVETTTPTGYDKDEAATVYFYWVSKDGTTTSETIYNALPDNLKTDVGAATNIILIAEGGGVHYIENTRENEITVEKKWLKADGTPDEGTAVTVQLQKIKKRLDACTVTVKFEGYGGYDAGSEVYSVKPGTTVDIEISGQYTWNTLTFTQGEKTTSLQGTTEGILSYTSEEITGDTTITISYGWNGIWQNVTVDYTVGGYAQDGDAVDVYEPVVLDSSNGWKHTWENLPSTEDGEEIYYKVKEISTIDGYTTSYLNNSGIQKGDITIINRKDEEKTGLTVIKKWGNDGNDAPTNTETKVWVQLMKADDANKTNAATEGDPVELNNSNSWSCTWEDLSATSYYYVVELQQNADGTVKEENGAVVPVEENGTVTVSYTTYTVTYEGDPIQGGTTGTITITNTKQDTNYTLPETGGTGTQNYLLAGAALMAGSVAIYYGTRKRKGGEKGNVA